MRRSGRRRTARKEPHPFSRLDAHVHLWELARRGQPWIDPAGMPELARDFGLVDLRAALASADVDAALLVQVLNDPAETDDYLWLARDPALLGVVGWVDLVADSVEADLIALQSHPSGSRLVGIRHQALAESDPAGWLCAAGDRAGFRALARSGLAFDLMLRPEHLATARQVAARHDGVQFVLDHAGKAPVAAGWGSPVARDWARAVSRLAELPHVVAKLSGLTTMADPTGWTVADLAPVVEHLLAAFGPERLLYGSDWPVSLRAGTYRRTVGAVGELLAGLSPSEQAAVLGGTARRVYRLDEPTAPKRYAARPATPSR